MVNFPPFLCGVEKELPAVKVLATLILLPFLDAVGGIALLDGMVVLLSAM